MFKRCYTFVFIVLLSILASRFAIAQDTTSADELQTIIAELREGQPNYEDMEATLRIAVREQLPRIQPWLQQLGRIVDVRYETTENGIDIYLVQHQRGRTIWQFGRSPRGRVGVLWFNGI